MPAELPFTEQICTETSRLVPLISSCCCERGHTFWSHLPWCRLVSLLTFQIRINADHVDIVFFFVLQSHVTNKIERCLKLRPLSSDVCLSRTRGKNVTVFCDDSGKVHLVSKTKGKSENNARPYGPYVDWREN